MFSRRHFGETCCGLNWRSQFPSKHYSQNVGQSPSTQEEPMVKLKPAVKAFKTNFLHSIINPSGVQMCPVLFGFSYKRECLSPDFIPPVCKALFLKCCFVLFFKTFFPVLFTSISKSCWCFNEVVNCWAAWWEDLRLLKLHDWFVPIRLCLLQCWVENHLPEKWFGQEV